MYETAVLDSNSVAFWNDDNYMVRHEIPGFPQQDNSRGDPGLHQISFGITLQASRHDITAMDNSRNLFDHLLTLTWWFHMISIATLVHRIFSRTNQVCSFLIWKESQLLEAWQVAGHLTWVLSHVIACQRSQRGEKATFFVLWDGSKKGQS